MHQPLLVGVVQRLGHRRHQFDRFVERQPGLLEPRGEVGAVDVLRDDEAGALLGAADIVDGNDVRMVEVGDGAGFGQIGFGVFGPGDQLAVRHLDGDEPLQLVVVGQVDEAEAALAQDPLDPVATDLAGRGFRRDGRDGCGPGSSTVGFRSFMAHAALRHRVSSHQVEYPQRVAGARAASAAWLAAASAAA